MMKPLRPRPLTTLRILGRSWNIDLAEISKSEDFEKSLDSAEFSARISVGRIDGEEPPQGGASVVTCREGSLFRPV